MIFRKSEIDLRKAINTCVEVEPKVAELKHKQVASEQLVLNKWII
jgi:hypothetical protein